MRDAPRGFGTVLIGLLALLLTAAGLAPFVHRPDADPIDIGAAQQMLDQLTNPVGVGPGAATAVYRDCVDSNCATAVRAFPVPAGSTLASVLKDLDRWTVAQGYPNVNAVLECNAGRTMTAAGAPVGECVVGLAPLATAGVQLGFQIGGGYPKTGRPWFAYPELPVTGVVAFVTVSRPGLYD